MGGFVNFLLFISCLVALGIGGVSVATFLEDKRKFRELYATKQPTGGPSRSWMWRPIEQANTGLKHGDRADIWLVTHDIPEGLRYPGAIWSAQMHCFVDSLRSPVSLSDATHFMVVEGPKQWKS